ncbi:DUF4381 domain-containing protein [Aestuariibacter sp. AA17]|uniref:DUF4381 domain-containing protein n=1 Tax=Fluctibacter corallii TaxID=2984329 RepID=A0ABT3A9P6_9ALTE|nr:DUF4381 domain-containing protein [Aestuariibacter sp. AA17]MCV2885401.1 DUF4381 domain-containing protein [Aestuariibacter sp. AA17]
MSQLHDITIPTDVSIWPLATGWWILLILCVVIGTATTYTFVKRRQKRVEKKVALRILSQIDPDDDQWPVLVNDVLKRAAIHYCEALQIAPLYGEKWVSFLCSQVSSKVKDQIRLPLLELQTCLYSEGGSTTIPKQDVIKAAQIWLNTALPPKKLTTRGGHE